MEGEEVSGDAIAFSIKGLPALARWRGARRSVSRIHCVLRLERRRSEKRSWEKVMNQHAELRSLMVLEHLERHRFEYRVSLWACNDAFVLPVPTSLMVPRITSTSRHSHPHVGSIDLVVLQQPRTATSTHIKLSTPASSIAFSYFLVVISLIALLFAIGQRCWKWFRHWESVRKSHSDMAVTPLPAKYYARPKKPSTNTKKTQNTRNREILTTELPEFNDEEGWREFFDAEIYGGVDAPKTACDNPLTERTSQMSSQSEEGTRLRRAPSAHPSAGSTATPYVNEVPSSPTSDEFGEFWQM